MEFPRQPQRRRPEAIVPMINIVFLLLVFFLMTATITPPDPLEVIPPVADDAGITTAGEVLHVDAAGRLALGALRGETVYGAAAEIDGPLKLRADARLPASELVDILARLAAEGATDIELVAVQR